MMNKERSEKHKHARASLPDELKPIFNELVTEAFETLSILLADIAVLLMGATGTVTVHRLVL